MTDWTTIPNSSLETGKPIRAVDGRALRDNPIAISEGATGAPKIQPEALDLFYGSGSGTGYILTVTDLDNVLAVLLTVRGSTSTTGGAAAVYVYYQLSSDNGTSWGSSIAILKSPSSSSAQTASGATVVDITSYNAVRLYVSGASTGGSYTGYGEITGI